MTTDTADSTATQHWEERDILTHYDTREFTEPDSDRRRVIVVQFALCHDPTTDTHRLGRATYYIECDFPDDPIDSRRRTRIAYDTIDTPTPSEQDAERHLAEFDRATLHWNEPDPDEYGPGGTWIENFWPDGANIISRHYQD